MGSNSAETSLRAPSCHRPPNAGDLEAAADLLEKHGYSGRAEEVRTFARAEIPRIGSPSITPEQHDLMLAHLCTVHGCNGMGCVSCIRDLNAMLVIGGIVVT